MRGRAILYIAAICCILGSQATPYPHDDDESPASGSQELHNVPSVGSPVISDPAIAYIPPKDGVADTHHDDMDMDMGMDMGGIEGEKHHHANETEDGSIPPEQMSYWLWPEHRGLLYTHVICMIIAWAFILPIGVMLGVAQSPFHVPVQFAFLILTIIGVIFAIMYNSATPDFYENNAHHKIGWVIIWMLVAQISSGLIRGVARYVNGDLHHAPTRSHEIAQHAEDMFMLGDDNDADDMDDDAIELKTRTRKSVDSGNGTGETTPRDASTSESSSPTTAAPPMPFVVRRSSENTLLNDRERHFDSIDISRPENAESKMENYIAKKLSNRRWFSRISRRGAFVAKLVHAIIGRPLWCLGFIQVLTGIVTVTGIFKAWDVYNGLAHFIKGGVFFNYGIITLGRYFGVFADFGWAWNLKPPGELTGQKWKNRIPTAEFVESFFIMLYGGTQSFMEHLGNHDGGLWSAKDLEHVSIAIMFFWAGLCGVLVEIPAFKRSFNRTIERTLSMRGRAVQYQPIGGAANATPREAPGFKPPPQQGFSYNPFPGLIIFMTGIMMSMHHQESMLSTMVHKQWGYLLSGFAIFRLGTYFLIYLSPPTSYIPSRPVTELLTSFCLICGGLIFMASNSNTVDALDVKDVDAMFVFNLAVSFSALVMAWIIVVMAIKGWAVSRRRH